MTALVEKLAGRRVVASISGGKDSAAMSLYLRELGIEHDRVFLDTGWEHAKTYEYLRGELTRVIGPITEIRAERDMVATIRKKGMFPSKRRRFCTRELKVFPMQRHLAALMDAGVEVVNTVGIRRAESEARSKMEEWEWSEGFDCEVWRPILLWTEEQVIAIHKRHGLAPNPLYLMGASRVGCWPCIYARKAEIKLVADTDPDRIALIRALEREVQPRMQYRAQARGSVLENDPSWFQAPMATRATCATCAGEAHSCDVCREHVETFDEAGDPEPWRCPNACATCGGSGIVTKGGDCWPIDKVVEWSKTARGGRQFELFAADPASEGCMRWGMCDTGDGEKTP